MIGSLTLNASGNGSVNRPFKTCKVCWKSILKPRKNYTWARYYKRIYCSQKCSLLDPERSKKISAAAMGRTPWNKNKEFPQMRGNKHAFRGNAATPNAGRARAQALYKEIKPCEHCGLIKTGWRQMVRHHRDRNTLNNSAENIAFLCRACHAKEHRAELHTWRKTNLAGRPNGAIGLAPQAGSAKPPAPSRTI